MRTRRAARLVLAALLAGTVGSLSAVSAPAQDAESAAAASADAEPAPSPTPAVRSFECRVDAPGERCTLPLDDAAHVEGVVAYREEHTGKWIDFGRGPFDREGRPDGCGWVLRFRERLVEERGCFVDGKRNGPWETCFMRLGVPDGQEGPARLKCPTTEYAMGVIVVKPKEPEPERVDEEAEPEEGVADEAPVAGSKKGG